MKSKIVLLIGFAFVKSISAQFGTTANIAARNLAVTGDGASFANNPASFPLEKRGAGLFVQNRFLGTKLNYGGIQGNIKIKNWAMGASFSSFGTQYLNYIKSEFYYGMMLNTKISVGAAIGMDVNKQFDAYKDQKYLTGKLAVHAQIAAKSVMDVVLQNPWYSNPEFNYQEAKIHACYTYETNVNSKLWLHAQSTSSKQFIAGVGFSHKLKKIGFAGSLQNGLEPIGASISLLKSKYELGFSTTYHVYLGFVPAIQFRTVKF